MKCINRRCSTAAAMLACILCTSLVTGCGKTEVFSDSFTADSLEYGITAGDTDTDISYFAKDLCVTDGDVEAVSADTSESYAALFFNVDTREVLYAKNIYDRLYPASTTKLMTALLALEHGNLDSQVTVSQEAITFHENGVSTAKLKAGDSLTVRQLLYALLLPSANDAANVIAEAVGGSVDQFTAMMNEKAQALGATGSHFVNANGLQDENHYTTAYDLYLIFQAAMKYDDFMEILQTPEYEASYQAADGTAVSAVWKSTNQFTAGNTAVPEGVSAVGGKTGTTTAARSCLVQLFTDAQGQRYVAIILGCKERAILYEEMLSFLSNLNN